MRLLLFGIGMQEIIVIALVVLLLFGGKKIPELMNGLGKGVKSFKDGMKDVSADPSEGGESVPPTPSPSQDGEKGEVQ